MILSVRDGTFGYQKQNKILNHISFQVQSGDITMILGKNGVGKTTLLKCVAGLLKWDCGGTYLDGTAEKKALFEHTSYVAQFHRTVFSYRVIDIVCMGLTKKMGYFAVPGEKEKKEAMKVMREMKIDDLAEEECSSLSGGQLQLVMIARALVSDPDILIMDEPEAHLDIKKQRDVLKLVKNMVKQRNMICLINTHYPEHALKYADNVLVLGKGGYLYGKKEEIVTEQNLLEYLDVETHIIDLTAVGYQEKIIYITE